MKKMLLSAALAMAALTANAQGELCVFNGSSLGLNADAVTPVTAGTEIASSASVKATIKFDDSYKLVNMKAGSYIINGEEVSIPEGSAIQGNGNGKGDCATSTNFAGQGGAGCVYEFAPSQDGYLYLLISASANKQYVVYENELSRMPYIYASEDVTDADPNLTVFAYDMMDLEGATYLDETVGDYYVTADYAIDKVSVIVTGTETKSDGNGLLKFKVYKDCTWKDHEYNRTINNKNKILSMLEGGNGIKTGYTKAAGRCLVSSAQRNGKEVICVVLDCGPMFEDSCKLINAAFEELEKDAAAKE